MLKVTEENFEKEVLESEVPVLIDFFATWCMPCKMFSPILEEIAEEWKEKLKVVKVDVDEAMGLALEYKVVSIPTMKLMKNREVLGSFVGAMSKEELEDWLGEYYGKE